MEEGEEKEKGSKRMKKKKKEMNEGSEGGGGSFIRGKGRGGGGGLGKGREMKEHCGFAGPDTTWTCMDVHGFTGCPPGALELQYGHRTGMQQHSSTPTFTSTSLFLSHSLSHSLSHTHTHSLTHSRIRDPMVRAFLCLVYERF